MPIETDPKTLRKKSRDFFWFSPMLRRQLQDKSADADLMGFKREVDPLGLCNPGKMRSYVPVR